MADPSTPKPDMAAVFDACAELALKRLADILKDKNCGATEVIAASKELRELEKRHQRQYSRHRREIS